MSVLGRSYTFEGDTRAIRQNIGVCLFNCEIPRLPSKWTTISQITDLKKGKPEPGPINILQRKFYATLIFQAF